MFGVDTDTNDPPLAASDFAFIADFLHTGTHLHTTNRGERLETVDDSSFCQIVRSHLHFHLIARNNADAIKPHFPRKMRNNGVAVLKLHAKRPRREQFDDFPLKFNNVFDVFGWTHNNYLWRTWSNNNTV